MWFVTLLALAFAVPAFPSRNRHARFDCLTGLETFANSSGNTFIADRRERNSDEMRAFGYVPALALIRSYSQLIHPGETVLEVGPYFNPLGPEFGSHIHWLVWEYDAFAARQIASNSQLPTRTVFRIDLNALNKLGWKRFMGENEARLGTRLGAAVFSSVLNYVNYRVVLANVIPRLRDGGLLIIANSEIAFGKPFDTNSRAAPTVGLVEYLMSTYGNQIEFLPGSEIQPESGISPSTISLALRIYKTSPATRRDQYDDAVSMYLENTNNIGWDDRAVRNQLFPWLLERRSRAENQALQEGWQRRKQRLLEEFFAERERLIERVRTAEGWEGGFSWDRLERQLFSVRDLKYFLKEISKYELIPERRILLRALDIPNLVERGRMIRERISELYQSLGHVSSGEH